jgi:dihydroorotate dehydrogenase (NAD+) catalytic subunit
MPVPDLTIRLGSLPLKSPVVCGAGEHVAEESALRAAIDAGAAAVVAKSANESEDGRRQWEVREQVLLDGDGRVVERSSAQGVSIFNRSGLVPIPWDEWLAVLARADEHARTRGAYVVASIIPADPGALPTLAAEVEAAGVRWVELNLSAPHAGESRPGSVARADSPDAAAALTAAVREAVSIPLTVKLSGESADVVALAREARAAGADHVAMIGRHMAFVPDLATRRPVLGTFGAIGGDWALPLTMRWVAKTRLAFGPELPIVGTNGARTGGDVARLLLAGASAVQVATSVIVEGFGALGRITEELTAYLAQEDLDAAELVGQAADAVATYEEVALRSSS